MSVDNLHPARVLGWWLLAAAVITIPRFLEKLAISWVDSLDGSLLEQFLKPIAIPLAPQKSNLLKNRLFCQQTLAMHAQQCRVGDTDWSPVLQSERFCCLKLRS